MKEIDIKIGKKDFRVKLAETEEQKEKGLQDIKKLDSKEGMLFLFSNNELVSF